jgi:hypothetical protein
MVVYFFHKASHSTHKRPAVRRFGDAGCDHLLSSNSNALIASFMGGCCYPAIDIFIAFCNHVLKLNVKIVETTPGRFGRRRSSQRGAPSDQGTLEKWWDVPILAEFTILSSIFLWTHKTASARRSDILAKSFSDGRFQRASWRVSPKIVGARDRAKGTLAIEPTFASAPSRAPTPCHLPARLPDQLRPI